MKMNFTEFKNKFQKVSVEHYSNNVPKEPIISVSVHTYQHANYIEDCLKGILMQETEFSFEILLGEDASTDGTREICIEYAKKYPEKIRLFLHKRANNIQIQNRPSGRFNFLYNLHNARGKYIAICEGDDYWTDPLKLQKQVEFMERHNEYSLCFHNSKVMYENGNKSPHLFRKLENRKYNIEELIKGPWFVPTQSILFRSRFLEIPRWINYLFGGDYALQLILADKGPFYCLNDTMSVYRKNNTGISSGGDARMFAQYLINVLTYFDYYSEFRYHKKIEKRKKEIIHELEWKKIRQDHPIKRALNINFYLIAFSNFIEKYIK
ncbi:hypothetical protein CK503_13510 [Aliifodinibius salipaludis]|uniref:Glycosyltransferase 2-like domain-containing protein n=1 Tax=Fodinibius salipaludis TaxID=2032627 RepID=A0A2A2G6C0_9BACT|nr:glycosyltransferase [Aliifodinibius salipaludis]PAU93171.1 hypothetical protein CK503_13510 [Aliifodinibius salipaludis]